MSQFSRIEIQGICCTMRSVDEDMPHVIVTVALPGGFQWKDIVPQVPSDIDGQLDLVKFCINKAQLAHKEKHASVGA